MASNIGSSFIHSSSFIHLHSFIFIPQQQNRGRKREEINAEDSSWLVEFLERPGITYVTPGKNDQIYMGKSNGEKVFKQKSICFGL